MKRPTISVIIPAYNRAQHIAAAIESVLDQEYSACEIIVVDDGSTDDTARVLTRYEDSIKILSQSNRGAGLARNAGAALASGEFLAFLDSDDRWFPWTLSTFARCVAEYPAAGWFAGTSSVDGEINFGAMLAREWRCVLESEENLWIATPAVCMRSDIFHTLGGFESLRVGEDLDLWFRAGCVERFVYITNPPLFQQTYHPGQVTRGNTSAQIADFNELLNREDANVYPGSGRLRSARLGRLAQGARSLSMACIRDGLLKDGWRLYSRTWRFQARSKRWRYLAGFPLAAVAAGVRRIVNEPNRDSE